MGIRGWGARMYVDVRKNFWGLWIGCDIGCTTNFHSFLMPIYIKTVMDANNVTAIMIR